MFESMNSSIDESVNYIERGDGVLESRYVHRPNTDYFVCYLSSHTGCNMACRFCHLTATGQTYMRDASLEELEEQAKAVFTNVPKDIKKVHFNFMARGEPLASKTILYDWGRVHNTLAYTAGRNGIFDVKIKVSTIMPNSLKTDLRFLFGRETDLYYSLYSLRPEFRKRWLPKAMDPYRALAQIKAWQQHTDAKVVIHMPFIHGENDSEIESAEMIAAIRALDINTRFNLVRYNPPNSKSKESSQAEDRFRQWKDAFPESKIIPRVGLDVKASCGMFVNG